MRKLLAVALGGCLGAGLRFLLIVIAAPLDEWSLHAAALSANVIGCFVIGFLFVWADCFSIRADLNAFVFTGIIGSLTTFSTFGLVSAHLLADGHIAVALAYVAGSNGGGLALTVCGIYLGQRFFSHEVAL